MDDIRQKFDNYFDSLSCEEKDLINEYLLIRLKEARAKGSEEAERQIVGELLDYHEKWDGTLMGIIQKIESKSYKRQTAQPETNRKEE